MLLPPLREEQKLTFSHFPALYQCVIYRNWGQVPVSRIAAVIGATEEQVREEAALLGLWENPGYEDEWLTKGYITIIRQNWHILSYENICRLLDWTEDYLAFILREDDFLEVKLGRFKPGTGDCTIRPLTAEEAAKTAEIRRITEQAAAGLPEVWAKPFDFRPGFQPGSWKAGEIRDPRFEERYIYSFCALYGDTFADRALIDASFPDELLASYAALGITGIWTHIVLYKMVRFPFDETMSEGYGKRQEGMKYLTEKLEKYGLKLFLYFNEPRAMPTSFYDSHPEVRGHAAKYEDYTALCISTPEVETYLRDGVTELCRAVPKLGGFFTITASENLTNCRSHAAKDDCSCPRCSKLTAADLYAKVNRLVCEGVEKAGTDTKIIAWSWGWLPEHIDECIEKMPARAAVMNVSEQGVTKDIQGTVTSVLDYSISVEGPGALSRHVWEKAKAEGHRSYAKMQVNNSWELASVPYIPVFEKFYRHICRISEENGAFNPGLANPDGIMLSWTLGGYPSPVLKMFSMFYDRAEKIPTLGEVYEKLYPGCDTARIEAAVHEFSEAFDAYPFHIGTAYDGPQLYAPANLLRKEKTHFAATMVGFPHDDIGSWKSIFPTEVYISQLKLLTDGWEKGMALLKTAAETSDTPEFRELYQTAELCSCHLRSMYLQAYYITKRETDEDLSWLIREEAEISLRAAKVITANPAMAYESSNHYFYTVNGLIEKIVSLKTQF